MLKWLRPFPVLLGGKRRTAPADNSSAVKTTEISTNWMNNDPQDHSGFFVHPDECVTCGCCQDLSPVIFDWWGREIDPPSSHVLRQPDTDEELDSVVTAQRVCMVDCIYYGGKDKEVIALMRKRGVSEDCIIHS